MNKSDLVPLSAAVVVLLAIVLVGCQTVTEPVIEPASAPSESVETAVRVDPDPLSIQGYGLYQRGGSGPLLPITNGSEMRSGDQYKVYFRANRDCHVYVVEFADDTCYSYVPNDFDPSTRIRGGRRYWVPDDIGRNVQLVVPGDSGTRTVRIFACRQEIGVTRIVARPGSNSARLRDIRALGSGQTFAENSAKYTVVP